MTTPSLKKVLLPSILLAGTVFSSLTLPLVLSGSEPVVVQLKEEPLFVGDLKDIAAPYIGVATVLSLGAGLVSMSVAGWKSSSQKAQQIESKMFSLQQQLKEKEDHLEEILVSETRLHAAGLSFFLDEKTESHQPQTSSFIPVNTYSLATQNNTSLVEPVMPSPQAMNAVAPSQMHLSESAAVPSHPAQAPIGFAYADRAMAASLEQSESAVSTDISVSAAFQVKQLQDQLKQIVNQVEQLQSAL